MLKSSHDAKLQAFVKMQMACNQPKTFQNRGIFQELNNATLGEMPSKIIRRTLVFTCLLRVEPLYTLFAIALGILR